MDIIVEDIETAHAEALIEHAYLVSYDIAQNVCDIYLKDARRKLHAAIMADPSGEDYWRNVVARESSVTAATDRLMETIGQAWRSRCADMAALVEVVK